MNICGEIGLRAFVGNRETILVNVIVYIGFVYIPSCRQKATVTVLTECKGEPIGKGLGRTVSALPYLSWAST